MNVEQLSGRGLNREIVCEIGSRWKFTELEMNLNRNVLLCSNGIARLLNWLTINRNNSVIFESLLRNDTICSSFIVFVSFQSGFESRIFLDLLYLGIYRFESLYDLFFEFWSFNLWFQFFQLESRIFLNLLQISRYLSLFGSL